MTPSRWTVMLGNDGPDFAVEGHAVQAFPELDRVEVVDVESYELVLAALRRAHEALDAEHGHTSETWADRERYG